MNRQLDVTDALLRAQFQNLYQTPARFFRAAGRVNLIGEHTDYNDGLVFPAAIGFFTWVAAAPRSDRRLKVFSANFNESVEFKLDEIEISPNHWINYVKGVALMLEREGYGLPGVDLLIRGEVPVGVGLSSSAALEVSVAFALVSLAGRKIESLELAQLCQRAEAEFVGMRCGIMDQFASSHGREGHALMLDCRTLEYQSVRLNPGIRLVICNTGVKHELASSEYNQRRWECEEGVRRLSSNLPGIRALRDVSLEDLYQHGCTLPKEIYKRCRHVITENQRVLDSFQALENADYEAFGRLMYESHTSLQADYKVSCKELNILVKLASEVRGVYGARMMGGGFGGCTINLVESQYVESFKREIRQGYGEAINQDPEVYVCATAGSVEECYTAP